MRLRSTLFLGLTALVAPCGAQTPAPEGPEPPQRIVSINLVSDILLLDLVDPGRIVALSWLSGDPDTSPVAARVNAFQKIRGHAEEILPLRPDLVVGAAWGQDRTLRLAETTGIPTHRVALAQSYAEIESAILGLAARVGDMDRGEVLVRHMRGRLAALRETGPTAHGTAVWLGQGGFHHGDHELARTQLTDAGWLPLGTGRASLETIVLHPPDAVIEARYLTDRPTLSSRLREHPALARLRARTLVVRLADLLPATQLSPSVSEELRRQSAP